MYNIDDETTKKMVADNQNDDSDEMINDPSKLDGDSEEKLTSWAKEPTIADLKADLEYARQENTEQVANVEGWLNLRNATGVESGVKTKTPGRSSVQPKLIRKHNEWRYPGLSEPFLNSDRMFEIKPRTGNDQAAARQNQTVLNWQFDTKLDKVDLIDRYVRKTVDEGTCVLRVGWERKTEKVTVQKPVYEYYELDQFEDADQLEVLAQAAQMYHDDAEAFEADPNIPDDLRAAVEYTMENGVTVMAEEVGMEDAIEDKVTFNQPSVKIIEVANFFIDPSCQGNWQEAAYMVHTYESTQSDLKKRGIYKNLDKVNWGANAIKAQAGDPDHTSTTPITDTRTDTTKTKVLVYEYWGEYDIHDDGILVPVVVTWVGDTVIQMTENPFPDRRPPFIIVPYMPILGSTFGEADASILQDNQRILGAVTRGMIDLLGRSANAQTAFAKGFLDPVNRKRFIQGEDFEFNPGNDPRQAIQQLQYPEIPNSALQIASTQNQEAEALTGVKSFSGGISGEAYGQVARGITGAIDAAGQREMSILRRLAEGMKQVATKILSMNVFFLEEKEVIRVTDEEFIEIKRKDLAGNFDLKVDISTAQIDETKANDLGMILQTVGPDMDPGLRSVILAEIADLKRMPHLAMQIRNYKPEPDPMQQKIQELEIQKLEAEIQYETARAEKAMAEAQATRSETEMEVSGVKHQQAIEAAGAQARGNRDLEVTKGLLAGQTPAQQIEAAVGFNKLTEETDRQQAAPKPTAPSPTPFPPMGSGSMAPIQPESQQVLALPQ